MWYFKIPLSGFVLGIVSNQFGLFICFPFSVEATISGQSGLEEQSNFIPLKGKQAITKISLRV
jgi:hypothetical protein